MPTYFKIVTLLNPPIYLLECAYSFLLFFFLSYFRGRERVLPSTCLLPKCSQQPGLSLAEARSKELNLALLHTMQESGLLSHHSCLPASVLAETSSQDLEPGINPRYCLGGGHLNCWVKQPSNASISFLDSR